MAAQLITVDPEPDEPHRCTSSVTAVNLLEALAALAESETRPGGRRVADETS